MSLAPVAPSGCPRAIAPPLTLTRAGSACRSRCQASTTEAKASLISTRSMSASVRPLLDSAYCVAGMGAVNIQMGSAPRTERWWMRARGLSRLRLTAPSEAISSAAAASAIWLDTAAVMRPPAVSASSVAIFSSVVPTRGVSSCCRPLMGAISRAKKPRSMARVARRLLSSANSSICRRVIFHFAAIISAARNCDTSSPP